MPIHGIFKAALNGIHERGTGGFVYVKGDACRYMFPRELVGQQEMSGTLSDLLAEEKADHVFYVVEERDQSLHLLAYPRDRVLKDVVEDSSRVLEV